MNQIRESHHHLVPSQPKILQENKMEQNDFKPVFYLRYGVLVFLNFLIYYSTLPWLDIYIYYIYPELRVGNCRSRSGKGARPL